MAAGDILQTHTQHGGGYVTSVSFELPQNVSERSTLVLWIGTANDEGLSSVDNVSDSLGNDWTFVPGDDGGSRWGELW